MLTEAAQLKLNVLYIRPKMRMLQHFLNVIITPHFFFVSQYLRNYPGFDKMGYNELTLILLFKRKIIMTILKSNVRPAFHIYSS